MYAGSSGHGASVCAHLPPRSPKPVIDHQWDEARRLVSDLDMTEVGTENREWITYMLLSCAVFGAGTVAKKKPSFVGVGSFDTFLKQVTNNFLMYLEYAGTGQVQAEALQSIAEDEAKTKALPKVAWDEHKHPRDAEGQFTVSGAGVRPARPVSTEAYAIEGGHGPARAEWVKRNKAVMEADDVSFAARDAHVQIAARLEQKYPKDTPFTEYEDADFTDYTTSKEKALEAGRALEKAEAALKRQDPVMKKEVIHNVATGVAERMGIDPTHHRRGVLRTQRIQSGEPDVL